MPKHADYNLSKLRLKSASAKSKMESLVESSLSLDPEVFAEREKRSAEAMREFDSYMAAAQLQEAVLTIPVEYLTRLVGGKYRQISWRPVTVTMCSGLTVSIWMPYYARKCAPGKGFFPHVIQLGLIVGATPALASLVAKYASALSSFTEAKEMLAELGIEMSEKRIRTIALAFAKLAEIGRIHDNKTEEFSADSTENMTSSVSHRSNPETDGDINASQGCRRKLAVAKVLLSTDGGRVRIREKKRGPKTKKGRSRYRAEWREPKLIIVMVIGEDGRPLRGFPPIIDATMGGPDAAIELLRQSLGAYDLEKADAVFVADGARWIWERVEALLTKLGIADRCRRLVDFYHLCSHLETIAANLKKFTGKAKKTWLKRMRKWLLSGREKDVLASIEEVTTGSRNKTLKRERLYFRRHSEHMSFADAKKNGFPMGSGAVESAIRRVINLKLKGPGIIWNRDSVERMLTLRSYFKAGRWSQLERWAIQGQIVNKT